MDEIDDDTATNDTASPDDTASSGDTELSDVAGVAAASVAPAEHVLDLAAIEADLADVEVALQRLDAGTYWTCEVTGQPLPDDLMAAEPTRRRLPTS